VLYPFLHASCGVTTSSSRCPVLRYTHTHTHLKGAHFSGIHTKTHTQTHSQSSSFLSCLYPLRGAQAPCCLPCCPTRTQIACILKHTQTQSAYIHSYAHTQKCAHSHAYTNSTHPKQTLPTSSFFILNIPSYLILLHRNPSS